MSLEGFSKKGMELGNSPEQINEAKNDLRQQYLNAIKKLALQKMRNDLLFEGSLGAAMKNLSSIGLDVSKESMLKDIETEVNRQRMSFDIEMPNVNIEVPNVIAENQSEIEQLKSNLGSIFESAPVQEQKPIYNSGTIPREPAIQNTQPYETIINNTLSQINQPVQTPVNNEQEIRQQLQKAQEEIRQKLERTRQQPNEPTMTFTGNLENLSDAVKQRIIQQMESRGEVIISSIDNIYQEGNYIVVDAKDNQGRFTGTEFTLDDFTKLVNQPSTIAKTEEISQQQTDNMIKSPVQEQSIQQPIQEQPQQISQDESKKILQERQKQMKDQIISQIMAGMNNAGEFSFGDISMAERMNIMQNVQNKLNAKSIDELQMLLSTYQEQNIQEETISNGMRR
ncbi:MAG: hypothetical protein SO167_03530 [Bacilli bacterium]|nr:hypothetical protein [Bacillota bacterium]MDY4858753.1 hypothetical protein [Bacilli bacterium]MDY5336331.1 hypothetical protein [Bacilli bacterium]